MLLIDYDKTYIIESSEICSVLHLKELSCKKLSYILVQNRDKITNNNQFHKKIPPISIHGHNFEEIVLEIGKCDLTSCKLEPGEIEIGNVFIEAIDCWKYTKPNDEKGYCYKLYLMGGENSISIYEHEGNLCSFFEGVLPEINNDIKSKFKLSEINFNFFQECLRFVGNDNAGHPLYTSFYPDDFVSVYNSILSMIYNCRLEKHVWEIPYDTSIKKYGLSIKIKSPFIFNPYIQWLLSKNISDMNFVFEKGSKYYIGVVSAIPEYVKEELELGDTIYSDYRNHVILKLLSSIILNFKQEHCKHGWKYKTPIWENDDYIVPRITPNLYNHYCIFQSIKHWHYKDGTYRVGKEDSEWDEDTYAIPVISGCKISESILLAIEKELGINLSYQEDSQRYYCVVRGKWEYISWMARREGGEVCNEEILFKILKILIKENNELLNT